MAEEVQIQPKYLVPEISTKVFKATYNYLSKYHLKPVFYKICSELEIPPDFLLNDDNWHSNELNKKFCNRLIDLTNDDQILYKIGVEFLTPENINYFEYTLIKSSPPLVYFSLLPAAMKKVNKILDMEIISVRPGKLTYKVIPARGKKPHPGVIENMLGCLQSFKNTFGLNSLSVERSQCITRGDDSTILEIKYSAMSFWISRFFIIASTFLASYVATEIWTTFGEQYNLPIGFISTFALFVSFIVLFFTGRSLINLLKGNSQYYQNTAEKNHDIYEKNRQLNVSYHEANHIKELCFKLLQQNDPHKVIQSCLESLSSQPRYRTSIVMILNKKRGALYTAGFQGIEKNQTRLKKLEISYPSKRSDNSLFANILSAGKTVLIDDMSEYKSKLKIENEMLINLFNVNSLIICPLQDESSKYGLLITGSLNENQILEKKDTFHIENIANLLSLFFQSTSNLETEKTIRSTYEKYVPAAVHEKIEALQDMDNWRIAPQSVNLTSFFIDLRGFTALTENSNPEEIFEFLNLYVEFVAAKIGKYGGIVDNIVADQVVAFFIENQGSGKRHAKDALLCGIDILGSWQDMKAQFLQKGFPELEAGIGIHSGRASAGTLGSSNRCNYTSLGDTINVASRLQDLTKKKRPGETLLIASQFTIERSGLDINYEILKNETLRGRNETIDIGLITLDDALNMQEQRPLKTSKLKAS